MSDERKTLLEFVTSSSRMGMSRCEIENELVKLGRFSESLWPRASAGEWSLRITELIDAGELVEVDGWLRPVTRAKAKQQSLFD